MSPASSQDAAIKALIKKGYVLHMDPDYLLLTYGDVTTGNMPQHTIGPRYALCVGVEGEATFWTLMSTKGGEYRQLVPEDAREGAWAHNGHTSYLSLNQLWVMTKDMALEAHRQVNSVRSTYKHSFVTVGKLTPWPALPVTYPKNFTPINRLAKQAIPVIPAAAPLFRDKSGLPAPVIPAPLAAQLAKAMEAPIAIKGRTPHVRKEAQEPVAPLTIEWRPWLREMREAKALTLKGVADAMGLPETTINSMSAMETGAHNRWFSPAERDAWARVMGLGLDDPRVLQIPVLSESMTLHREESRQRIIAGQTKRREAAPAPAAAPKVKSPKPPSSPVEDLVPLESDRKANIDRAAKLLSNPRLTDEEVRRIVATLERTTIDILLGA
jgi:transcriptional regulator with XRE-family HTH domain